LQARAQNAAELTNFNAQQDICDAGNPRGTAARLLPRAHPKRIIDLRRTAAPHPKRIIDVRRAAAELPRATRSSGHRTPFFLCFWFLIFESLETGDILCALAGTWRTATIGCDSNPWAQKHSENGGPRKYMHIF